MEFWRQKKIEIREGSGAVEGLRAHGSSERGTATEFSGADYAVEGLCMAPFASFFVYALAMSAVRPVTSRIG